MRISHGQAATVLACIAAGLLFFALGRISGRFWDSQDYYKHQGWSSGHRKADTLVVYNYANRDWEYPRNFAFFVRHGEAARHTSSCCVISSLLTYAVQATASVKSENIDT